MLIGKRNLQAQHPVEQEIQVVQGIHHQEIQEEQDVDLVEEMEERHVQHAVERVENMSVILFQIIQAQHQGQIGMKNGKLAESAVEVGNKAVHPVEEMEGDK